MLFHFLTQMIPRRIPAAVLGIDVQPEGVNVVALKQLPKGYQIERLVTKLLPTVGVRGHGFTNSGLSTLLSGLVREHGWQKRLVALSLPIASVHLHKLMLPLTMREDDIEKEVATLGGNNNAKSVDFAELKAHPPDFRNVIGVTTKQEIIKEQMDCMHHAGLQLRIIDLDVYAITRAVCYALEWQLPLENMGAILYCRQDHCLLIGFDFEDVLFHQTLRIEDANLIQQIQQHIISALSVHQLQSLHQIAICGVGMNNIKLTGLPWVKCSQPFARVRGLEGAPYEVDLQNYWIAYGLALRKMPSW